MKKNVNVYINNTTINDTNNTDIDISNTYTTNTNITNTNIDDMNTIVGLHCEKKVFWRIAQDMLWQLWRIWGQGQFGSHYEEKQHSLDFT